MLGFELEFVPAGEAEPAWRLSYKTFAGLLAALNEELALRPKEHELRVVCPMNVTDEQLSELTSQDALMITFRPET